jgi:NAD(P) transhydrogenase
MSVMSVDAEGCDTLSGELDVVVVGGADGGPEVAVEAARAGARVVLVESERRLGGRLFGREVPRRVLRRRAQAWTESGVATRSPDMESLLHGAFAELLAERDAVLGRLAEAGVHVVFGRPRFVDATALRVERSRGGPLHLRMRHAVLASGSRLATPASVRLDGQRVFAGDEVLALPRLPRSVAIVGGPGGGTLAVEYASIFAALGVDVTWVDVRSTPIPFVEPALAAHVLGRLRSRGVRVVCDADVDSVRPQGTGVVVSLPGAASIRADVAVVALSHRGRTDGLGLDAIGVEHAADGSVVVDADGRTAASSVWAVGSARGPMLPAMARAQGVWAGRRFADRSVGAGPVAADIDTVPGIGMVGRTVSQARDAFGTCRVGCATDADAACVLVADPEGRLVGVHAVGPMARDHVRLGSMAIASRSTVREALLDGPVGVVGPMLRRAAESLVVHDGVRARDVA